MESFQANICCHSLLLASICDPGSKSSMRSIFVFLLKVETALLAHIDATFTSKPVLRFGKSNFKRLFFSKTV